ncbi:hypothetical protein CHGG_10517 [Chaetomium globosum CBS 148.51]|uniref:Uncharacterized protein n=1 Tax=Chaetomium globosum (strain ATCC 6205 / CBS 148.51 / DSM 1962 / NBRC 6347 / NRRL 1970) TaxID=306901 RepID=Q2GND7_CHAGB|nr:uncharacterized protein CHGG_10517 [Chaetomium globosum CBS 148.51]EAQ84113.1 hypothetical protein CHGG_10517 [Chaetomium globosum CBS 148.51]
MKRLAVLYLSFIGSLALAAKKNLIIDTDLFSDVDWYFTLGEYASKVAYHFSGGSLRWGHAEDAWDPVELYRKVLSEAEDSSVTIVSIGFLDNVRPPPNHHSPKHPNTQN